jgi:RimJ/RimL family protein N-acetyltransferase/cytidylate kinase
MLPRVNLTDVSREDVDRVASWLADDDVSSQWFGEYACGNPVHRAYVPQMMLEASQEQWARVFDNPKRAVLSAYTEVGEHVGEGEIILDGKEGAELSVLIGRKDLWRHGYGTAVVQSLIAKAFDGMNLQKVWAMVPDENAAARGLFRKLGFVVEGSREHCGHDEGPDWSSSIMSMTFIEFAARRADEPRRKWAPIAIVSGLPGSGSKEIARDIARMLGSRFVDEEITTELCSRLRCSQGELESLEDSFRSTWGRWLRRLAAPMHWSAGTELGFDVYAAVSRLDYYEPVELISKDNYLRELRSVVRRIAAKGNAVIHGRGAHLLVSEAARSVSVFVAASKEWRLANLARGESLTGDEACKALKRADRDTLAACRYLFDVDFENSGLYDLSINPERVPTTMAAQTVAGALGISIDDAVLVSNRDAAVRV